MSNEEAIRQTQQVISRWCWDHDFDDFCAATGWTSAYAKDKWHALQDLNAALTAFDPVTLAKILSPAAQEPPP
jgi:hypothetical protein